MKVFGLMGRIGTGKGTVADILIQEYGFRSITMGDLVREEVAARGLEPTREITTKISTELRAKDPAYFIKKAVEKIKNSSHDKWLIDGIRMPLDVNEFSEAFPNIKFILVKVDDHIRYERMKARGRPGFPETFEKFLEHNQLEEDRFKLTETYSHADYTLTNNGTMEELQQKARDLIKSLL